jgi:hydroxypyruvate isomerase
MPNLSVCIEAFWHDLPLEARIRRVKALGFSTFEFWGWRGRNLAEIRAAKEETGLTLAAICTDPGFNLVDRGDDGPIVTSMVESAATARSLGAKRLIATTGNVLADESHENTRRRVVRRLRKAAPALAEHGITLVLEPLNPIVDHKGYWLTRLPEAVDIVAEVDSPFVKVLDDLYHQQLTEGNLIANLTQFAPWIGHYHAAGVPGRHELVGGELDYRGIFKAIDDSGHAGYVGLEFWPAGDEDAALRQALSLVDPG